MSERDLNTTASQGADIKQEADTKKVSTTRKYLPGVYRSEKFMRIIKALTFTHQKDDNGKIQKTYGTWANDKNMIIFPKGKDVRLSKEDVALTAIQRLIDSKVIFRVGE